jgi:bifunctional DNA-binding transcriptional regulator/antitoxin component of YhaV-PrlF toxin-antitoxin module
MNVIQVNERGTLTLPKTLRKPLGLAKGGILLAEVSEQGVLLKPSVAFPVEMYSDARIAEFDRAEAELDRHLRRKRR